MGDMMEDEKPIVVAPTWADGGSGDRSNLSNRSNPGGDGTAAAEDEPTGVENVRAGRAEGVEPAGVNYTQRMIDWIEERMRGIHMPSAEDLERERRRKRTQGVISGIADGLSALGNLVFTTRYAPNMYNGGDSLTGRWRERWERLAKERDADADRYLNYSLMIGKLRDAEEQKAYQRGRDALQDNIREAKAEYDARMADIRYRREVQKLGAAEAAAEAKEANDALERMLKQARIDELASRTRWNDRRPATGGGRSGGGSAGQFEVRRVNPQTGVEEYRGGFKTEAAARNFAATHGRDGWVYNTTPVRRSSTGPNKWGKQQTTETETDVSTPKVIIDWN